MRNEKTANFKQFVIDVIAICQNIQATINSDVDIVITDGSDILIIESNDIKKYYDGYIMSHQERTDAIQRAAKYVERMAREWKK